MGFLPSVYPELEVLYGDNLLKNFNPVTTSYCQLFDPKFRLFARRKNFRREFAQIRRTSAKNIFRRTPPNVRRTFGGLRRSPCGYRRIRAGSAANWRKSSLEKCPPTKTSLTPRFHTEKTSGGRSAESAGKLFWRKFAGSARFCAEGLPPSE